MLRQKRQIALRFPSEAESHLVDGGSRLSPGTLMVHVRPRVFFARWTPLTGMDNPPVFRGHVDRNPDGITISGTIRETRAVAALPFALLLTCAVGLVLIYLGISDDQGRAISIALGTFLAILFAVLFLLRMRSRRPRFRREAGELEHGIDTYVRTGAVSRTVT